MVTRLKENNLFHTVDNIENLQHWLKDWIPEGEMSAFVATYVTFNTVTRHYNKLLDDMESKMEETEEESSMLSCENYNFGRWLSEKMGLSQDEISNIASGFDIFENKEET